ncbi:uncharacterized protein LOC119585966 [Penaeus monodon]|uniref:uncharacterized protein LOC119585966 n=1 Tax=Penaeus monodon TaxID=6687 RepID=UPI0018A7CA41|nr:uncharacterized protein LOC119585966 [Penaeus monodon]
MILLRIRRQLHEILETQFGFRKDKATRNAIFVMGILAETVIQHQQNIYLVFIDYQKAFDKEISGCKINNLRYVDDIVLMATSANNLKESSYVVEDSKHLGLYVNSKKTKYMVSRRSIWLGDEGEVEINGSPVS